MDYGRLRFAPAFDDDTLGPAEREALRVSAALLIDEFITDVATASEGAWSIHDTSMASYLPVRYLPRFMPNHAREFVVALITVVWKLGQPVWSWPACLAEELALNALVAMARTLIDADEGLAEYHAFEDTAYMDTDFRWLFESEQDGIEETEIGERLGVGSLALRDWNQPYGGASAVHPYLWSDTDTPDNPVRS